jgi:hypothetical protein
MFYILCANFDVTTSSILSDDSSCQEPIWEDGTIINNDDHDLSHLCFVSETPHIQPFPDFSRDGHGCPVFSQRLKNLFEMQGIGNIQYFPAKIVEYNSQERKNGYYAANILGLVNCVDREKSKFKQTSSGNIKKLKSLVIDENTPRDLYIFRLGEVQRVILINARFKEILKDAAITGLQLIPAEQWDGYDGFKL